MRIGARTLKTGLGVLLSILIASFIPHMDPMQPAWIAIMGLQQSVKKTWDTLLNRTLAAFLGGGTALLTYWSFGNSPVIVAATIVIFILLMNVLKLQNVIGLASITVVIIMLTPTTDFLSLFYVALFRVLENILGVFVSFLINVFVSPPHYERTVYELINTTSSEIQIRLRAILRQNGEYTSLNSDLAWANKQIEQINHLYALAKDEVVWNPKLRLNRQRRLVVLRQFIIVLQEMTHFLELIHSHTNILFIIDDTLRRRIRERIETLCSAAEQISLKYDQRISPKEVNFFNPTKGTREALMQDIFEAASIKDAKMDMVHLEKSNTLILIAGAMVSFEKELIHLNMLVRSFYLYHNDNQKDKVENLERIRKI